MVEDCILHVVDENWIKPNDKQPITSNWSIMKKFNGTYGERLIARGFQHKEGEHYNNFALLSLVTYDKQFRWPWQFW